MSLFTNTINYTKSAIVTAFALCAAAMSSFAQRPSMLPTRTLLIEKAHLFVAAGDEWLEVLDLQLAGKKRMPARDFLNGFKNLPDYHMV